MSINRLSDYWKSTKCQSRKKILNHYSCFWYVLQIHIIYSLVSSSVRKTNVFARTKTTIRRSTLVNLTWNSGEFWTGDPITLALERSWYRYLCAVRIRQICLPLCCNTRELFILTTSDINTNKYSQNLILNSVDCVRHFATWSEGTGQRCSKFHWSPYVCLMKCILVTERQNKTRWRTVMSKMNWPSFDWNYLNK